MQAMAKLHVVGYREDDVYLHCAPLFHIGGLSSMVAMLAVGATQVRVPKRLHCEPKYSIKVVAMQSDVGSCHTHGSAGTCFEGWCTCRCSSQSSLQQRPCP